MLKYSKFIMKTGDFKDIFIWKLVVYTFYILKLPVELWLLFLIIRLMTIITPLFREIIIKHDLKIDKRVLEKILSWDWTIQYNSAIKIQKEIREVTWKLFPLRNLFFLDKLKWYEKERKVVYEYSENPLSKDEWINIVRFVIERRWDA